MTSSNPALRRLEDLAVAHGEDRVTIQSVTQRLLFSCVPLFGAFIVTWEMAMRATEPSAVMPWLWGGLLGGLVIGLVITLGRLANVFTVSLYAFAQGLFLGAISAFIEMQYPGIALQAFAGTVGCFLIALTLYQTGVIKVTPGFRKYMLVAMGGIMFMYLISLVGRLFGFELPFIHSSGPLGIGISIVIVGIATLSLLLDFDAIERAVQQGIAERHSWQLAFGLLVTLIWIYMEVLRLLAKLRGRN